MVEYYDDNFGEWDMEGDSEEKQQFYKQVQSESILKECSLCEEKVKLRREYDKCNSCMDKLERGMQW
tara:strand:+ start:577 stop:777 length:201 start_codon:yes stop_codon:yes gene_type:complete